VFLPKKKKKNLYKSSEKIIQIRFVVQRKEETIVQSINHRPDHTFRAWACCVIYGRVPFVESSWKWANVYLNDL
jgi:hypothetical protein